MGELVLLRPDSGVIVTRYGRYGLCWNKIHCLWSNHWVTWLCQHRCGVCNKKNVSEWWLMMAPPVVCKWNTTYLQLRGFLPVKGNETAWLPGLHIVKDPPTAATNRKTAACWSAVQQLEAVLAGNGFLWIGDTSDTPIYDNVVSWEHGDEKWDFWFSDKPGCQKSVGLSLQL